METDMAWLLTLFRNSTAWIFFGVVAFFLAYGSWQEHKLNKAERAAAEWQQRAETAEANMAAMKDRLEALNLMLKEYGKALDEAASRKNRQRKLLAEAKRNDKGADDWSRAAVPDGVKRVLNGKGKRKK